MNWLHYSLMTVACWGVYGIFLHSGTMSMGDPTFGRIKAFLIVGVAYFLVAILAPMGILAARGANWGMPAKGVLWSLLAGTVGALGALFVLLAFGAKGSPLIVMAIVFAGAPVVNALLSIAMHPPASGLRWQFILGLVLAAFGGFLVSYFKPAPTPSGKPAASQSALKRHIPGEARVVYVPKKYHVT